MNLRALFKAIVLSTAFLALSAHSAKAEDYISTQAYVHAFNNDITVVTGVFALNKDISLETSAYFKYTIDSINPSFLDADAQSGASTASSAPSSPSDTRNELMAGVRHEFPGLFGFEFYYDYSREKDYASDTPTLSLKKDLFGKNTTISLGYSRNMDKVSGQYLLKTEDRTTNNYFIGLTQVFTPVLVGQIGYSRSASSGQMSEGIRLVPLGSVAPSTCIAVSPTCVPEKLPDTKTRHAYLMGFNYYIAEGLYGLLDRSAVKPKLRYYTDDWGIKSYTFEVEFDKYVTDSDILTLTARVYDQTRASFYDRQYSGTEEFLSASPQHLDFGTQLYGIKWKHDFGAGVFPGLFEKLAIEAKYEMYQETTVIDANIFMLGIRATM
ncbi:MAG: DUF3570 domain-containing protein [Deltaproteobacteria bacterium]|nr:DUF3570 domain-containing protein [Deltaproteobacteria bacterium]